MNSFDDRSNTARNTAARNRVAIIGGGPGGLMTAYLLQRKYHAPVDITIFESSNRLGGKIITRQFSRGCGTYEAGAAELYDYSATGPDPLRELVAELGLSTHSMHGRGVFLGDELLRSDDDLARIAGADALAIYRAFVAKARLLISPQDYYESDWKEDNGDPLARQTLEALLATIKNETVRRYIEVSIHSDLATEPRHTSAMYGLQNFLMNEPGYMSLYGIDGGIECLPRELTRRINAEIKLNSTVHRVRSNDDETFRVTWRADGREAGDTFDIVVVALPNYWIPSIEWSGGSLAAAMRAHHDHYDYPAHYLRVSILFREPFWRDTIAESYFMTDALGGCCVYDETSRCASSAGQTSATPILGWLIGGEMALSLTNLDDDALIARVLDSLPEPLGAGRELFVEGRVHRWVGAVNALPGGFPLREPDSRHVPDPVNHPMLFVVGDYLFDSTLNGVLDSAECVAEWITEETEEEVIAASGALERPTPTVSHVINGKVTAALTSVLNGSGPH